MQEMKMNLQYEKLVRKSRYKSYKGTIGKVAKNQSSFHYAIRSSKSSDGRNGI